MPKSVNTDMDHDSEKEWQVSMTSDNDRKTVL